MANGQGAALPLARTTLPVMSTQVLNSNEHPPVTVMSTRVHILFTLSYSLSYSLSFHSLFNN